MIQLDYPMLAFVKEAIRSLSTSDLQIHCLFELFRCQSEIQEDVMVAQQMSMYQGNQQGSHNSSLMLSFTPNTQLIPAFPEQAMRERQNRRTYLYLTQALQILFDQIDMANSLNPGCFYEVTHESALQAIDQILMASLRDFVASNNIQINKLDIQQYVKLVINELCPQEQTRVYTVDSSQSGRNFIEGTDGVWSQNFIFYNCFENKVLCFVLKAVPEFRDEEHHGYADLLDDDNYDDDYQQKELTEEEASQRFFLI